MAEEVRAAIVRGTPAHVRYGVSHERAWEVGIACGGSLEVLVQPAVPASVLTAAESPTGSVVATVLDGAAAGREITIGESAADVASPIGRCGRGGARAGRSRTLALPVDGADSPVFLEVFARPGAWSSSVAFTSPRPWCRWPAWRATTRSWPTGAPRYLTRERFPDADELILAWPDEAFARIGIDAGTCVAVLTHDPKFDDPALLIALRSPAAYVGAIGSKQTQASRRERLRAAGLTAAELGACTDRSVSISGAGPPRRPPWRSWRR